MSCVFTNAAKTNRQVRAPGPVISSQPRTLQRKCACGTPGSTGECEGCRKKRLLRSSGQEELRVNFPGDAFEREADRAAQAVGSGKSTPVLSRLRGGPQPNESDSPPDLVHEVLTAGGQPLDQPTRGLMERRFGHDFSRVRVHTDARANESAHGVNAVAYTVGQNIAFRAGAYAPGTPSGQRLLAHELAHVVQQRGGALAIQRETYYGGAYKQRAFASLDAEIAAAAKHPTEWHPATPDMAATAAGSGGGEAVSTFDDLLTKLEAKGKGSITVLNLIGHSNSSVFSLGGTITVDNVEFTPEASIESDSLSKNAKRVAALRDRFAEGAKIVLYSCDAGAGQGLLDAIGTAFGVCVEGFTTEVWWCLTKKKDGTADRGRVWAQNPYDVLSPDAPTDCKQFASNMTTLTHNGASAQCGAKKP
jgi:hypothetical protein